MSIVEFIGGQRRVAPEGCNAPYPSGDLPRVWKPFSTARQSISTHSASIWLAVSGTAMLSVAAVGYLQNLNAAATDAFTLFGFGLVFTAPIVGRLDGKQKFGAAEINILSALANREPLPDAAHDQRPIALDAAAAGEGQLSAAVHVPGHLPEPLGEKDSRELVAQLAAAGVRTLSLLDLLTAPAFRVAHALEVYRTVYRVMRSGSPLALGPRTSTPFEPDLRVINDGAAIEQIARQVTAGAVEISADNAEVFVNAVRACLRYIEESVRKPVA